MLPVPDREERRRSIQADLDGARSGDDRNRWGQFATPPALARSMARLVLRRWRRSHGERAVRFLEPALGTGACWAAVLEAFGDRVTGACGIERDPALARVARQLWSGTGLRVRNADFLDQMPPAPGRRFDLIVTNPPYVRHHHLGVDQKARLRRHAQERGLEVSGLSSLYVYFLLFADRWLEEGGLACWLLPGEFLDVNYGAAVRSYLSREVSLLRLHRFEPADLQFGDALVTSTVVIYQKGTTGRGQGRRVHVRSSFTAGGSLERPAARRALSAAALSRSPRWSGLAREGASVAEEQRLRPDPDGTRPVCVGDLFEIRRGIATGANGFFVLPLRDALDRGIPRCALRPILPGARGLPLAVIESRADGYPALDRPLALLDCTRAEDEVLERWPGLWSYLQEGRARQVHLGYLTRRRRPWYAQERRQPAPFVCTYMGRATAARGFRPFRFFWNRSRAIAPNVYLMLYPRPALRAALDADPALGARVHAALEQIEAPVLVRHGRVYGGGLHKLEPRELAALCLTGEPARLWPRGEDA